MVRVIIFIFLVTYSLDASTANINKMKKDISFLKYKIDKLSKKNIKRDDIDEIIKNSNTILVKKFTADHKIVSKHILDLESTLKDIKKKVILQGEYNSKDLQSLEDKILSLSQKLITKESIAHLVKEAFLAELPKIQTEYRNAILSTNTNITYVAYTLTLFGIILSLLAFVAGYRINTQLKEFKEELNNEAQINKKIILNDIENKVITIEKNILTSTREYYDKVLTDIKNNAHNDVLSELKLATKDINRIHYYQYNLFYQAGQMFNTRLGRIDKWNKNDFLEIHGEYNMFYQKIADATSLDNVKMIKALKEMKAPTYTKLINTKSMKDYLEFLKIYDNDSKLRVSINDLLSKINH